jgi:hypothetical protein
MDTSAKPLSQLLIELEDAIYQEEITAQRAEKLLEKMRSVSRAIVERVKRVTGEEPGAQLESHP